MIKREAGFSFLELLIVMVIMGFVLAGGSDMFVSVLRGFSQQSKIAETNIEGIIGLELLRRDIESAGYGLPWSIPQVPTAISYSEASNATAQAFNDAPTNPPRAILSGDNIIAGGYVNGSDYLVIKAINVARSDACTKWTYLSSGGTATWEPSNENLDNDDRVIVISPGTPQTASRALVAPTGNPLTLLQQSGASASFSANETRIVYGVAPEDPVDPSSPLSRPFNRADYYVRVQPASDMPRRCAPGTGILYKAILNQADENLGVGLPLLDCVADMQVVTFLDQNPPLNLDGVADTYSNGLSMADAQTVRDQLKEIHVYILAHEGQRDTDYTYSANMIWVGEPGSTTLGRNFDLTTITDGQNYRWKIYTLVVKPNNLR
jgi:prepilin-type N-terminal cleavage/methylation domain-containing protein